MRPPATNRRGRRYTASERSWQRFGVVALAALLLATLAAASGCGGNEDDDPERREPVCYASSDCADGQVCRSGWCTAPKASTGKLHFLFSPPEDSTYVPQMVTDVKISATERADFALEPGVAVDGRITYSSSDQLGPESGTLVFRRRDGKSSRLNHQVPVRRGKFSALVAPGRYDLSFVPDDPGRVVGRVWTNREFTSDTQLQLRLPRTEDLDTIKGSISFRGGLAGATRQWVQGARVFAVSSDGEQTSTVDTTDEKGRYTIGVIPGKKSYDLHVRPVSADQLFPRAVFEDAFSASLEADTTNVSVSLGSFVHQSLRVKFNLKAPKNLEQSFTWAGTEVVAEAKLGKGTFTRTATIKGDGTSSTLELTLLPANYRVRVVPPRKSRLAPRTFEFDLVDAVGTKSLDLETKRSIDGKVVDSRGRGVDGVELEFRPRKQPGYQENEPQREPRPVSVTTGSDEAPSPGRFEVWLEQRPYLIAAIPPNGSGHPAGYFDVTGEGLEEAQTLTFELPPPVLTSGRVFGRSSDSVDPLSGTRIEVLREIDGEIVPVGRAKTDGNGRFQLILPAAQK